METLTAIAIIMVGGVCVGLTVTFCQAVVSVIKYIF